MAGAKTIYRIDTITTDAGTNRLYAFEVDACVSSDIWDVVREHAVQSIKDVIRKQLEAIQGINANCRSGSFYLKDNRSLRETYGLVTCFAETGSVYCGCGTSDSYAARQPNLAPHLEKDFKTLETSELVQLQKVLIDYWNRAVLGSDGKIVFPRINLAAN